MQHRSRAGEGGFTLAELMIVTLIAGLLLGVALPSFVGARNRSHDAVAYSRLKTAADTAYALSDFGTNFAAATPGALFLSEPSIEFLNASSPSTTLAEVSVAASTAENWTGVVRSTSGRCLAVFMNSAGRTYTETNDCRAADASAGLPGDQGYVPPSPTISGDARYEGHVPVATAFAPNRDFRSDDELFVFFEGSSTLASDLVVGGVVVPSGTTVCSYIVWYDPSFTTDVSATIDFGSPILLGAGTSADLRATGQFAAPSVDYFSYNRPWFDGDSFSFAGSVGFFDARAINSNADMIRVLTDCG